MASKGASAATGALGGAAAGTAIMPGIGTAAGAVIGGIGGWLMGGDDDGGGAPTYDPNQANFNFGLGYGVDAQGVTHPTPEEWAAFETDFENQRNAIWQERNNALKTLNDPNATYEQRTEAGRIYDASQAKLDEADKQFNQTRDQANKVVDTYAAQRTRETIGKQAGIAEIADEAYNRDAPQMEGATSSGQSYLQGADADGRSRQQQSLEALNAFAKAPEGPSAAQAQLQAGVDAASRQQYGMARSQQGGGGSALRNAAFNAAGISGNAGNEAARLRAQETAAYKQQQLAALNAASGAAGALRQGTQSFAATQAGQANADAALAQDTSKTNLQAELQGRQQNDATWLAATQTNAGYDAMRDNLAAQQQNSGVQYEQARAAGAGIASGNWGTQQQVDQQNTAAWIGAGSAALGAGATMMKSDERSKKLKEKESALSAALETVGNAPGYSYEYKDPSEPGAKAGRQYGPMAQDLEKGPLGDTLVKDTPTGKMVDTGRVAMMSASAITELNQRLKALEAALGKGKAA